MGRIIPGEQEHWYFLTIIIMVTAIKMIITMMVTVMVTGYYGYNAGYSNGLWLLW